MTTTEQLLDKYYQGLTTEAEEQQLRDYFRRDDVPAHLLADRQLFLELDAAAQPADVPEGLAQRLEALIDAQQRPARRIRMARLGWVVGIAASLLLLFSITLNTNTAQPTPQHREVTDPAEAYQLTSEALMLFSETLNEGINELNQL